MMGSKIAQKLLLYFAILLLLFSIVIAVIFTTVSQNKTQDIFKQEMEEKANKISLALSDSNRLKHGMSRDLDNYISLINSLFTEKVWVVNKDMDSIQTWQNKHCRANPIIRDDLPTGGEELIEKALEGETAYSTNFSSILEDSTITVGVPIYSTNNDVTGVVLLHSPVEQMESTYILGIQVLASSFLISVLLSIPISILLAVKFSKPLSLMRKNALKLADGDYSAKNSITNEGEIGELADTLDLLSDKLSTASKETERLHKLRQDFITNISHELRTPVTVIRGSLEAFLDNIIKTPEKAQSYHEQMYSETLYLQRLINDLLELSRVQNADFIIETQDLNLIELCNDALRTATYMATKKNITIAHNFKSEEPVFTSDYARIKQMLIIILDNAIKFSPNGGNVEFDLSYKDGKNIITVCDHGKGIEKDELPYIFERFYKSRDESNKKGTGLGLPIAKQLCLRQNIDISAKSENNSTLFTLIFP